MFIASLISDIASFIQEEYFKIQENFIRNSELYLVTFVKEWNFFLICDMLRNFVHIGTVPKISVCSTPLWCKPLPEIGICFHLMTLMKLPVLWNQSSHTRKKKIVPKYSICTRWSCFLKSQSYKLCRNNITIALLSDKFLTFRRVFGNLGTKILCSFRLLQFFLVYGLVDYFEDNSEYVSRTITDKT